MIVLDARKISKKYEKNIIFEDLDIHVNKSEVVAILGSSGIGKSTLLNILAGLSNPSSGSVFLNNVDITNKNGHVGYMLQHDLLLPFKTTIDNVCLPLFLKGVGKKEAYKIANEFFTIFKLDGYQKYYPNVLSGGMKQRAAFLRTFLYNNELLLLDEPFSALDAITKNELYAWFKSTLNSLGTSVLFITHEVDEAIRLANRIYVFTSDDKTTLVEVIIENNDNENFDCSLEFLQYKQQILKLIR